LIASLSEIRQDDTHRLIPSVAREESVFERLTEDELQMQDLFELDGATNERLLGEANVLPGISVRELLFGVTYAHVVNAAFTHAHPAGSRFNGPERGAWYAAFEIETAEAEIRFHKAQELEEIHWKESETFTFDDYLADFRAEFHDIRRDKRYAGCLVPNRYEESQALASSLLAEGSAGIVYPSLRRKSGTCLVCFRPALVLNVRKAGTVKMTLDKDLKGRTKKL
jgi:hypothetical protein